MNLNDLVKEIEKHNYLYWVLNKPEISDEVYDKLIESLRSIDSNHPLLNYIGSNNILNKKSIKHPVPMLSLDKAYTTEELYGWALKVARDPEELFKIEPKFDGWAARYDGQNLVTRGDGIEGELLNDKIQIIMVRTPKYYGPLLNYKESLLGEIVLTKSQFKELNSKYKTPRSALAGILSSDEIIYHFPCLELVSYDTFTQSLIVSLQGLKTFNFDLSLEQLKNWDYPTDGMVIKLADAKYSESLGTTNHHPRGQIALKPKNPSAMSKIKNIEWFVGKKNTITPVAIIEPVYILGHSIQKASLHNYNEFKKLDIHIGDTVLVERCGEIIPQIKKAFPGEVRKEIIISNCPSCDAPVQQDGLFLYCTNLDCSGSLAKRITDSCKRIGLENIGPGIVNKLIDYGIDSIIDIFELELPEIMTLPGFKDKSSENLYNEIQRIKNTPIEDWKVLSSLNIPNIGRTISKKLLSNYRLEQLISMSNYELEEIELIGPKRAQDIYQGLSSNEVLEYFMDNFTIIPSKQRSNIKKQTVCFTGKMPQVRSYYETLAEAKNMIPTNSVTKDLNLLIAADVTDTRGKLTKARKLGVKIISLEEFLNGA